ncbi:MAG TPA: DoxX subfamily [Acidobacteriota bacterium]|jgi:thiosulfate dehydrogenase [quinone] large subunit
MANSDASLSSLQRFSLVLLRTLIGWHFLYEGYYKLVLPAWTRQGQPLGHWTAAGYLKGATGPFAGLFHSLADPRWGSLVNGGVEILLLLIGLSLILGFLTQLGCWGALLFLTLVYLAAIPVHGIPQQGSEGTYLFVNKTLIEWVGVLVLTSFRTGEIAGLDLLWRRRESGVRAEAL